MGTWTSPYQYNPDRLPDSAFEPGSFAHIVVGNEGRALDYRRTPVRITEVKESSGLIILEILDFEDKGNTWELPFEGLGKFQFALGSIRAEEKDCARYERIAETLNTPLKIACEPDARNAALSDLRDAEQDALQWIRFRSAGLKAGVRVDFSRIDGLDVLYTWRVDTCTAHLGFADLRLQQRPRGRPAQFPVVVRGAVGQAGFVAIW